MLVALPWPTEDVSSLRGSWRWEDFDGTVDIYQNGNEYLTIPYDNIKVDGTRYTSSMWSFFGKHTSMTHAFLLDEPGIYSFVPKIKSKNEFKFSFSIYRSIWRE